QFVPWVTGAYILHLQEDQDLIKEYEADLRVVPDPLPAVALQRPASSLSVLPDAEVAFKMSVSDEIFAVKSVYLEYRRKNAEEQWLDDKPQRLELYHHQAMGRLLPRLGAWLAMVPRFMPAPLLGSDFSAR